MYFAQLFKFSQLFRQPKKYKFRFFYDFSTRAVKLHRHNGACVTVVPVYHCAGVSCEIITRTNNKPTSLYHWDLLPGPRLQLRVCTDFLLRACPLLRSSLPAGCNCAVIRSVQHFSSTIFSLVNQFVIDKNILYTISD